MNPSEADEIRAILRFIESSEPEVSGRSQPPLSVENRELIRLLADARLPAGKKEELMILLASNSQALEMLAAILKGDPNQTAVSEDTLL